MSSTTYKGTNKMIIGIVFGVITYWLFAQAMVNIVPAVQEDLGINLETLNIAISLTSLFSGMFIVVAGGLADRVGRKKLTYLGLILNIAGSLLLVLSQGAFFLIIGRVLQGLSAACIMPATIALMKAYFEGAERQRALSYWSIGSWGGSGVTSFAGGAIATYLGWKWIFIFSIVFSILAMLLIKEVPESKAETTGKFKFDYGGLVIFIIAMLALNIVITQGAEFGWTSPITLILAAIVVVSIFAFVRYEKRVKQTPLIDFKLFANKPYTGATISNFLLNAVAGTLIVANTYVQVGRGFSAFQSGMLSIGYLVAVLAMIRVGEKIMQRIGARNPMIWGTTLTLIGVAIMGLTFLPDTLYTITVFVGFILFGIGLGMYATPSTDTAVSSSPDNKIGEASGIYKMASSLGNAFGIAISATVYSAVAAFSTVNMAATAGIITNVIFAILSLISIIALVPRDAGESKKVS
ncbi:DHA2 family multidrug resistance protein-like MFS transporter [Gracilibacillus halotolerans]|uniref:DHA2 family multidrug resistance protein-like MFS transporter n=1 Tax=Gracilibacillus halotolerans TaxID=74386 RepID=A0A841RKN3_9BACI|nr:MFS transporter [Gracilibacillus halotolerans]MBB6512036.1 DHA2 family multidrug resistance protein-like MFS transporter [Gracilibacillus halotolerans]